MDYCWGGSYITAWVNYDLLGKRSDLIQLVFSCIYEERVIVVVGLSNSFVQCWFFKRDVFGEETGVNSMEYRLILLLFNWVGKNDSSSLIFKTLKESFILNEKRNDSRENSNIYFISLNKRAYVNNQNTMCESVTTNKLDNEEHISSSRHMYKWIKIYINEKKMIYINETLQQFFHFHLLEFFITFDFCLAAWNAWIFCFFLDSLSACSENKNVNTFVSTHSIQTLRRT